MERKLKSLFEYQRFEQNETLAKLIAETEDRMAKELSDSDLMMVAAAGDGGEKHAEERFESPIGPRPRP